MKEKRIVHNSLIETEDTVLYLKAALNLGGVSVKTVAQAGDKYKHGSYSGIVPQGSEYVRVTTKGDADPFYDEVGRLRSIRHEMDGTMDPFERAFNGPAANNPNIKDNQ